MRGRPRDVSLDQAIGAAGWTVLAHRGYGGLTFEEVAMLAGCSRPAIYRRFANKLELMLWMIDTVLRAAEPVVAYGMQPRAALTRHLMGYVAYLASPAGLAVSALAHARATDPALSSALDELYARERASYVVTLTAMLKRGTPRAKVHALVDNMIGAVTFRAGLRREKLGAKDIELIIDQALSGAQPKSATGRHKQDRH